MFKNITAAALCGFIFGVSVGTSAAFADEGGVWVSCDEYNAWQSLEAESVKCPACNTNERTETVQVEWTSPTNCTSSSCSFQNTSAGSRWNCSFAGMDSSGATRLCTVRYGRTGGVWGSGTVNTPCANAGVVAPPETSPDLAFIPDLNAAKNEAVSRAGEHCVCKDTCDKTKTCKIDPNYTPSVDSNPNNNGGVTGSTSMPNLTGTGAPHGCKGTVDIAVKVKCAGACERTPRYLSAEEQPVVCTE